MTVKKITSLALILLSSAVFAQDSIIKAPIKKTPLTQRQYLDSIKATLLDTIQSLNQNPDIDGILVQLPLPKHISEEKVIEAIDPRKDVDGFHPSNIGRLVQGLPKFIS